MDKLLIDLLEYGAIGSTHLELNPVSVQTAWETALFQCQHQIQEKQAVVEVLNRSCRRSAHMKRL